jgi:hypothetical protein
MRCRAMLGDAAGMTDARRRAATAMAQLGPPAPAASVYSVPRAEDPPYTATSLLLAGWLLARRLGCLKVVPSSPATPYSQYLARRLDR